MPHKLEEIINYCDANSSNDNIKFAHYLLNLSTDAREEMDDQIKYNLKRQKELRRTVPSIAFGEIKYCIFASLPSIKPMTDKQQSDYVYAACSRNEEISVMRINLEYNEKDQLTFASGKLLKFSDLEDNTEIERIKEFGRIKARDWVEAHKRAHGCVGRNEYCPCGSGKKYKHCCISNN